MGRVLGVRVSAGLGDRERGRGILGRAGVVDAGVWRRG